MPAFRGRMGALRYMIYALLAALGTVQFAIADCNGNSVITKDQHGIIKSPNYNTRDGETGHTAACIWNFSPPDGDQEHYLMFTIVDQRLYKRKVCSRSYNLTLQGIDVSCKNYINLDTAPLCTVFYDPNTCKEPSNEETCTTRDHKLSSSVNKEEISFPVTVTYRSDGKNFESGIVGFLAKYEFKECQKVASTSKSTNRRTVSPVPVTTTTTRRVKKAQGKKTDTGDEKGTDPGAPTTTKPSTTTLEDTTVPIPMSMIIGASVGCGALILIPVIVLVVCLYKRKRKVSSQDYLRWPPNNTTTTERGENYQPGAADTYDRLGGAVRANQSKAAGTYETLGNTRANQSSRFKGQNEQPSKAIELQGVEDPSPLRDSSDSNQQLPPANEPPEDGYEVCHTTEIKSQRPPIAPPPLIEKPWYGATKPVGASGQKGGYEVMKSQQGSSQPEIEEKKYDDVAGNRKYENLTKPVEGQKVVKIKPAKKQKKNPEYEIIEDPIHDIVHKPQESNQLYATPFENMMKDPHYIVPPRIRPQEELKRFRTEFPEKKGASLPTNSDGYVEFDGRKAPKSNPASDNQELEKTPKNE